MDIKDFRELKVWPKSHQLTLRIYKITAKFPPEERYGLMSQMRRAAVSIPANIAEGFRRRGKKDKTQFYRISQGSADELLYFLILGKDLGYINDIEEESDLIESVTKMLSGMIRGLDK